jgi:hypothetical protein
VAACINTIVLLMRVGLLAQARAGGVWVVLVIMIVIMLNGLYVLSVCMIIV